MVRVKRSQETEPEQETPQDTLQVTHDTDRNLVVFQLNEVPICLREPIAKDFMMLEGWLSRVSEDYKSIDFALVKLASLCSIADAESGAKPIGFETMTNNFITFDDADRVGRAIAFFRDPVGEWISRLAKRAADANSKQDL